MELKYASCCDLAMKPLNETQRDNVLEKILSIGKRDRNDRKEAVMEAVRELEDLEYEGYDVDSYFLVLKDFIERYFARG